MKRVRMPVILGAVSILCLCPATAIAAGKADLTFTILPKECFLEVITDGSQQINYVRPEDCEKLLEDDALPLQPAGQATGFPLATPFTSQNGNRRNSTGDQPSQAGLLSEDAIGQRSVTRKIADWLGVGAVESPPARVVSVITLIVLVVLVAIDGIVFELRWSKRAYGAAKRGTNAATRPIRRRS